MSASTFKALVEKEMEACVQALLRLKSADPDVTGLQSRYAAFKTTLDLYKRSERTDDDEDGV